MSESRPPALLRIALSGSSVWPKAWREAVSSRVYKDLDEQLARLQPGDTFVLRWGKARRGVDREGELWFAERLNGPHGVLLVPEEVPADWDHCVTEPYRDARGLMVRPCPTDPSHRRPNKYGRGEGDTICPSAGHRRNPDIPAHPDYPVNLLIAHCYNDSTGTSRTIDHARRFKVNCHPFYAYPPRAPQAAAAAPADRHPGGGEG